MQLSDAIDQYLTWRRAKGARPNTLRAERHTLNLFLSDVGNVNTRSLVHRHVDVFWAKRTTWGEGSMNKGRSHLSAFFKWCQNRGHIARDNNLLDDSKALRVPERARILIPQASFSTFLEGLEPRTRAICAIGLYLFTRVSETSMLRWQDILFSDGKVMVYREKTGTTDSLPLCEELARELKRWQLAYATRLGRPLRPADYVIPYMDRPEWTGTPGVRGQLLQLSSPDYQPNRRAPLAHPIKKALKDAGYYQPYEGGHTLRRSGAVALYHELAERGHDKAIRLCQFMLGHKSIKTTEIYLRLTLEEKEAQDLLAGKPMFQVSEGAVVPLEVAGVHLS